MKMLHAGDKLEEPSVVVESELCARHMIVSGKLIEQGGQGAPGNLLVFSESTMIRCSPGGSASLAFAVLLQVVSDQERDADHREPAEGRTDQEVQADGRR